jgi:hypothetical protein
LAVEQGVPAAGDAVLTEAGRDVSPHLSKMEQLAFRQTSLRFDFAAIAGPNIYLKL